MPEERPQAIILFSDDNRDEVGNKTSLMGIWGAEVRTTPNRRVPIVACNFFAWLTKDSAKITGKIRLVNAPEGLKPPRDFERVVQKPQNDRSERWLVQFVAPLYGFPVEEQPVRIEATFTIDDFEYSHYAILDPLPETDQAVPASLKTSRTQSRTRPRKRD